MIFYFNNRLPLNPPLNKRGETARNMKYIAKNEAETVKIGEKISAKLKGGDILCLYGDLGAGKTTLVKGLAKGFGITKEVVSPSFAIMNVYEIGDCRRDSSTSLRMTGLRFATPCKRQANLTMPCKRKSTVKQLAHFDLYRLKDVEEFLDTGGADYLGAPDTICVIEWPEKIEELLKNKKTIDIAIEHLKNGREIKF